MEMGCAAGSLFLPTGTDRPAYVLYNLAATPFLIDRVYKEALSFLAFKIDKDMGSQWSPGSRFKRRSGVPFYRTIVSEHSNYPIL